MIGELDAQQLDASELLCTGTIMVENLQAGCVRFSAFRGQSGAARLPLGRSARPAVAVRLIAVRRPRLRAAQQHAPAAIARGGEDGTEIGAFHSLLTPVKLDSLRAKVNEFLPFGLIPIFITET